jgi:predicted MFS family arabinose efflux permease
VASPFIALVPAMVVAGLHVHGVHRAAAGTSLLVTAQGVGAVIGVLALPALARRVGRGAMVRAALFALPVLLVLYGLAPSLWTAAGALFALGAGYIAVLSGLNTVVQLRAPTVARGRVLSCFMLALGTAYPIGAVIEGALGRTVGVRSVTVGGAILLAALLIVVAVTRRTALTVLGQDVQVSHEPAPASGARTA